MARKRVTTEQPDSILVDFDFEDKIYQIDTERRKVYRRFVEIETSRASTIMLSWRARPISV